jgi:F-type H+-transporting ATPase subunit delta
MARQDKIAATYAKAIAGFLKTEELIRSSIKEFRDFAELADKNPDLRRLVSSEIFPLDQRRAVIEELCSHLKISETTKKILVVLSNARRLAATGSIANKLHGLLLASAGVVPLDVQSATDLSAEEREKVERKFSKLLQKEIDAKYSIDPGLIGGLRVTAGAKTYDGSLAGWLSDVQEQLVGGKL